jgi:nucleotide-binding universal stress UspA family protein
MKKILIALDYNPSAQKVAEVGYAFAKAMNAEVILLHVISDAAYYSSLNYSPIMGFDSFINSDMIHADIVRELRKAAINFLDKSKQHLEDKNIQTVIKDGNFGESILDAAKELKVDVIVMGTHSRRGLDKILMGSVAEKVLRHSSIPLFIIPTREQEEM